MGSFSEYLRPTLLCDFAQAPEIRNVAGRLTGKAVDRRQMFNCINQFVKEIPYGLEDWDVKASETLRKGWGMCSGKASLLVAMSRSLEIPARYRIARIKAEGTLWKWIAKQNGELARQVGGPSPEQDHVTAEVYLDGWEVCDPSRDTALERGLKRLHITRRRELIIGTDNKPQVIILASLDHWAQARQDARRFKKDRESIFFSMNKQLDKIRWLGSEHPTSS